MTEQADATRLQIVLAASHEFARKSYTEVSLDDILTQAEVTKGAMYFHFRSKHELALAIIDRQNLLSYEMVSDVLSRRLSGLESLVDISVQIVSRDIDDEVARAGFNLLESIGRTAGARARVLHEWAQAFAELVRRANAEGDVIADRDPDDIGRLLVAVFMGLRQTTDVDDPRRYFADLEKAWVLTLPGFANPERIGYLDEFIKRRIALALTKATTAHRR